MSFWVESFWASPVDSIPNGVYVELTNMEIAVEVESGVEVDIQDTPIIVEVIFETLEVES